MHKLKFHDFHNLCRLTNDIRKLPNIAKKTVKQKKQDCFVVQVEQPYVQTLSDQMETGLQMAKLMSKLNDTLGPFLFYLVAFLLSNGTTKAYSQTGILFVRHAHVGVIIYFCFFSAMSAIYFLILFRVCTTAQDVENAAQNLKEAFQDSFLQSPYRFNPDKKAQHDILMQKLEEARVISPRQAFSINHSGYLSSICIVSTYLIVLTQFKVSEVAD